MSDLIRRADAIKAIEARVEDKYNQNDYEFGRNQAFEGAIMELEDLPTIDAVEVVHCRECKYWYPNGIGFCTIHDICPSQLDMADWFCADGERREDDA